ncbi:hypothetical protein J2W57_002505 [Chryseobacterium ginsenosidimutans]|uniref:Uncharacterized protein n=1 Tax=Chryseobacterium geocarposphaerae TaxID=1416776 RepID=A0ABU1LGJ8_9FLAO|nr:hypothetical protein [Chryseobacterium geocarposphaerae]MDR6699128.1 hypothetical protein [Chryseobacterium ginsenosidimutans]
MKILTFILGIFVFSCKAQILPLNTDYDVIPLNAYLKDLNNTRSLCGKLSIHY